MTEIPTRSAGRFRSAARDRPRRPVDDPRLGGVAEAGQVDRHEPFALPVGDIVESKPEADRVIGRVDHDDEPGRAGSTQVGDRPGLGPDDPQRAVAQRGLGRAQAEQRRGSTPAAPAPSALVPRKRAAAFGVDAAGQADLVAVVMHGAPGSVIWSSVASRTPSTRRRRASSEAAGVSCEPSRLSWTGRTAGS